MNETKCLRSRYLKSWLHNLLINLLSLVSTKLNENCSIFFVQNMLVNEWYSIVFSENQTQPRRKPSCWSDGRWHQSEWQGSNSHPQLRLCHSWTRYENSFEILSKLSKFIQYTYLSLVGLNILIWAQTWQVRTKPGVSVFNICWFFVL